MKKEQLLFEIIKSTKPLIFGLVKEERFYKFKPANSELRAKYKFLKIRSLLKSAEYAKYLKFEKKAKINILKVYSKNERFIIFMHYVLKCGRRKIHGMTGISERFIREFIAELKK